MGTTTSDPRGGDIGFDERRMQAEIIKVEVENLIGESEDSSGIKFNIDPNCTMVFIFVEDERECDSKFALLAKWAQKRFRGYISSYHQQCFILVLKEPKSFAENLVETILWNVTTAYGLRLMYQWMYEQQGHEF
jgi:hypothetical protein